MTRRPLDVDPDRAAIHYEPKNRRKKMRPFLVLMPDYLHDQLDRLYNAKDGQISKAGHIRLALKAYLRRQARELPE